VVGEGDVGVSAGEEGRGVLVGGTGVLVGTPEMRGMASKSIAGLIRRWGSIKVVGVGDTIRGIISLLITSLIPSKGDQAK